MILIIDNRYANKQKPGNNQNKDLVNENVRFPEVLLIGPNGEQIGKMSSREAQFKANEYDMDLLCVAPNAKPPVCKIINYSKYRFEQQKKAKEAKKNQHTVEVKEVQLPLPSLPPTAPSRREDSPGRPGRSGGPPPPDG